MCFLWISEQTVTFALYCINRSVFITEVESVYSAVRDESLYNTDKIRLQGLKRFYVKMWSEASLFTGFTYTESCLCTPSADGHRMLQDKGKPYDCVLCKKWKGTFITIAFFTVLPEIIKSYSVCLFINCVSVLSFFWWWWWWGGGMIFSTHFPSKNLHKKFKMHRLDFLFCPQVTTQ
jgi:hypothetical protein